MSSIAFNIFGHPVYWYGIIIALAVALAVVTASSREKISRMPNDTVIDFAIICMPAALICARIYFVAFKWENYAGDLRAIVNFREGGLAIYGGVIGGALAALFVSKKKKIRYGALADLIAPSLALGQGIGRWGNFFNQEAYGAVITNEKLCFFPFGVYIEALGEWHLATFFYESVWCIFIWIVLAVSVRRGKFERRRSGDVFLWYALMYSAERCLVEGLRTDSLYWGSVRVSQMLSALMLTAVCVYFFARARGGVKRTAAFATAAVCGICLILMSAGVIAYEPLTAAVCGLIAMGCTFAVYASEKRGTV